ncbi:hypothetical protein JCM5296_001818 [Sporobolomyces johnsonii]
MFNMKANIIIEIPEFENWPEELVPVHFFCTDPHHVEGCTHVFSASHHLINPVLCELTLKQGTSGVRMLEMWVTWLGLTGNGIMDIYIPSLTLASLLTMPVGLEWAKNKTMTLISTRKKLKPLRTIAGS